MFGSPMQALQKDNPDLAGWIHPCIVINNADDTGMQRLQIRVSQLHIGVQDTQLPWAKQVGNGRGNAAGCGTVDVPPIGTYGWCYFPEDDQYHIYYMGSDNFANTKLSELMTDYPNTYGRIDLAGNLFMVNQTTGVFTIWMATGTQINLTTTNTTMYIQGDFLVKATGNIGLEAGGNMYLDAAQILQNSGDNPANSLTSTTRTPPVIPPVANMTDY
jgi:hypothetical protein